MLKFLFLLFIKIICQLIVPFRIVCLNIYKNVAEMFIALQKDNILMLKVLKLEFLKMRALFVWNALMEAKNVVGVSMIQTN